MTSSSNNSGTHPDYVASFPDPSSSSAFLQSLSRIKGRLDDVNGSLKAMDLSFNQVSAAGISSFGALETVVDSYNGKAELSAKSFQQLTSILPLITNRAGIAGLAIGTLAFAVLKYVGAASEAKRVKLEQALLETEQSLAPKLKGLHAYEAARQSGKTHDEAREAKNRAEAQETYSQAQEKVFARVSEHVAEAGRLKAERVGLLDELAAAYKRSERHESLLGTPGAAGVVHGKAYREAQASIEDLTAKLQTNFDKWKHSEGAAEGELKSFTVEQEQERRPKEFESPTKDPAFLDFEAYINGLIDKSTAKPRAELPSWVDQNPTAYAALGGISDIPILSGKDAAGPLASSIAVVNETATAAAESTGTLTAGVKQLASGFETAKEKASDLGESLLESVPESLTGAARIISGSVGGVAGRIVGSITSAKSPQEAALNIAASFATSAKQFQQLIDAINPMLQAFADVLGTALVPIIRILEPVAGAYTKMFKAVEPILSLLLELNPVLFQATIAAQTFGRVVDAVSDTVLNAMIGVLKAIKKALNKLDISWKGLDDAIGSLKKMRDAGDEAAEALGSLSDTNIPPGYNLALRRWGADEANGPAGEAGSNSSDLMSQMIALMLQLQSASQSGNWVLVQMLLEQIEPLKQEMEAEEESGQPQAQSSSATSGGYGPTSESGGRTIIIEHLDVHGVQDAESLWRELERVGHRRGVVRRSNPLLGGFGRN